MTTGGASIPARRIPLRSRLPRPYWLDSIDGPATTRRVPLNKLLTHPIRIKMLVNTLKRRRRTLPQRFTYLRLKGQPRNSSIRLSTQRMQRLNSYTIYLCMGGITVSFNFSSKCRSTNRSSYLLSILHCFKATVKIRKFCLNLCALSFRVNAALHGLLTDLDQLPDPSGMAFEVFGQTVKLGTDPVSRCPFQPKIAGNPLINPGNLIKSDAHILQTRIRMLDRRRIPRLDPMKPISIRSSHQPSPPFFDEPDGLLLDEPPLPDEPLPELPLPEPPLPDEPDLFLAVAPRPAGPVTIAVKAVAIASI